MTDEPSVRVTLSQIYEKVQDTDDKVDKLATAVNQMVAINQRLDEHKGRLNNHSDRIRELEAHKVSAQTLQKARPHAPWWVIVGAIGTILTGTVAFIAILKLGA